METTQNGRPILSLSQVEAFDPQGPVGRRCCPLCGESKPRDSSHRSLSYDPSNGLWKCFRCAAGGVLQEYWKPPGLQAERVGQSRTGAPTPRPVFTSSSNLKDSKRPTNQRPRSALIQTKTSTESSGRDSTRPTSLPSDKSLVVAEDPPWKHRWEDSIPIGNTPGADYLERRGVPPEIASQAEVRFCRNWSGKPAVVFPIRDRAGNLVAAQARAIHGEAKLTGGPKKEGAFFAPITWKSGKTCRPLDAIAPAIIITEAPIDALSLACVGFPALAFCGTSGPSWLHIACGLRRVALAMDADEAGDQACDEISHLLAPFGARCERLRPEGAKDWNELLQKQGSNALADFLVTRLL